MKNYYEDMTKYEMGSLPTVDDNIRYYKSDADDIDLKTTFAVDS